MLSKGGKKFSLGPRINGQPPFRPEIDAPDNEPLADERLSTDCLPISRPNLPFFFFLTSFSLDFAWKKKLQLSIAIKQY